MVSPSVFFISTFTAKFCIKTEFGLKFSQVTLILEVCYEERDLNIGLRNWLSCLIYQNNLR